MRYVSVPSTSRIFALHALAALAAALVGVQSASAGQKVFNNSATGWNTGTAWTPTGAPIASDDVFFSGTLTTVMTLNNSSSTIQYITFTNSVSRTLANATASTTSTLTLGTPDGSGNLINVTPASGSPTFTIQNGASGTGVLNVVLGASGNFNVASGAILAVNSAINESGSQSLTKTGSGRLTLGGTDTYTGATAVNGGLLNVSGSLANTSGTTVNSSGTIGGAGSIVGPLTFVGTGAFAPGSPAAATPGTFTMAGGNVSFVSTSTLSYELNGGNNAVGGTANDLLTGVVNLTLDGTINVADAATGTWATPPAPGTSWRIINYTGTLFDMGLVVGSLPAGMDPTLHFDVDTSVTGQVNLIVALPEANAFLLAGLVGGAIGLGRVARKVSHRA